LIIDEFSWNLVLVLSSYFKYSLATIKDAARFSFSLKSSVLLLFSKTKFTAAPDGAFLPKSSAKNVMIFNPVSIRKSSSSLLFFESTWSTILFPLICNDIKSMSLFPGNLTRPSFDFTKIVSMIPKYAGVFFGCKILLAAGSCHALLFIFFKTISSAFKKL